MPLLCSNSYRTTAVLFFILCAIKVNAITGPIHGKAVVCYVGSWSVYRPNRGSFTLEHIDPTLCTHVIYAFAGLNVTHDSIRPLDPWQDLSENYGKAGYNRAVDLKKRYPHLKISIALGGWNEGSANYSALVKDTVRRQRFVENAVEFVRKYKFDGLDLDWEFPGKRGGAPEDKLNFLYLVKELRETFNKFNLLLTAAFGAGKDTIDIAYDVKGLSYYLDFIHLMCYDYHGTWDHETGANAPLRSDDVLNVEYSIKYMLKMGAPAEKLLTGIPLYGRTFLLTDSSYDLVQRSPKLKVEARNVTFQGPFTREDGFMGYNEICMELQNKSANWTLHWDEESRTPYAISGRKVISFDNAKSVEEKVRFAMEQKLGGVLVWSMDTDDFLGDCGGENFPLMRTINRVMSKSLETVEEEDKKNDIAKDKPDGGGSDSVYSNSLSLLCFLVLLINRSS